MSTITTIRTAFVALLVIVACCGGAVSVCHSAIPVAPPAGADRIFYVDPAGSNSSNKRDGQSPRRSWQPLSHIRNEGKDGAVFNFDGLWIGCVVENCLSWEQDSPGYTHYDRHWAPRTSENVIRNAVGVNDGRKEGGEETVGLVQAKPGSLPSPLRVIATEVVDGQNRRVHLRGVNTASMEWSSDGEGHILQTIRTAIQDWHVNIIRLPLAQDRWFGKAPEQTDDGKAYRALVKQVVDTCAERGAYVMLDLHWSDAGEWGKQIGQHVMPDKNSVEFWKSLADTYKNHPAVLFDLYNEPHDVTWDIWLKGGTVTEKTRTRGSTTVTEKTFEAVGMQALLDTVRGTGARNVVVAGGLDWAYDLSGILDGRQLSDPKGNGVIYANHAYPFKGDTVEKWISKMETATKKLPVIVSEFGAEPRRGPGQTAAPEGEARSTEWVRRVLQAMKEHDDWHWTAWDLHPAAGPSLISDWNYTPTPYFGAWVKQALLGTLPTYVPPPVPTAPAAASSSAPAAPTLPVPTP
jgi:hypothetical protein